MSSRSVFAALASFSAPFKVIGTATEYVRRDEAVWSPSNSRFALAYSIAEVRMNSSIGCVLWGAQREQGTAILGNPGNVHACCWDMPWCVWLDDEAFVFKAQAGSGRAANVGWRDVRELSRALQRGA